MGQGKQRLARFIERHPFCCFCGGGAPTKSIDHVPGRNFFLGRISPDDQEFPACEPCNQATRQDEQVVALLAFANPADEDSAWNAESAKKLQAIKNNFPGLLQNMMPGSRKVREFFAAQGARKPANVASNEVPIFSLEDPRIGAAVTAFARKLFCSLHYKHSGRIIPNDGGIVWRWFSNTQNVAGLIKNFIKSTDARQIVLKRNRSILNEQFSYLWNSSADGRHGAYVARFNRSIILLGLVSFNLEALRTEGNDRKLLQPYRW